jgi:hypothetical protein
MDERSAVDPNEIVLRRIHRTNFKADLPTPILRCEFEPKPRDTDGLSLYRQIILTPQELANAGRSAGNCYIAAVAVKDLLAMGLSVVPTPGDLPGHVSIPELSFGAFKADKARSKELQLALARLASRSIVLRPAE